MGIENYAEEWLNLGANVIGGCCQIEAESISKLKPIIDKWNLNN